MERDIGPKLTKLKAERQQYLEYQRIEREVEHMNRLFIIANLRALRQNSTIAENNLKMVRDNVSSKQQTIEKNKTRITELENEVQQINEHIDKQSGGKLSKLDEDLQEKRNVEIEADTELKQLKEAFTSEQKKLKQLEKDFNADKKTLATKEAEFEQVRPDYFLYYRTFHSTIHFSSSTSKIKTVFQCFCCVYALFLVNYSRTSI